MYLIDSFNIIEIEMKYEVNHESIPATLTQLARSARKISLTKTATIALTVEALLDFG